LGVIMALATGFSIKVQEVEALGSCGWLQRVLRGRVC
jgi:hypothetical protein